MTARLGNVAFDCQDVLVLAHFWSAVLGRALDEGSNAQFATIGGADGTRREPAFYFALGAGPKSDKNRVHLDLTDPDPAATDRLVELGATVVASHHYGGHRWTVLQDPEGNEFCLAAAPFSG